MNISLLDAIALLAAVVLATVFVWAGAQKARTPGQTADDFASLSLPYPKRLAAAVPIFEIGVAVLLLVAPGWGGVAAFGLLALFTAVLAGAVRSGSGASCACFGGTSRDPVSSRHLARNAALLALAVVAATFDGTTLALF